MTLPDRVSAFLTTRAPRPICDACVADHLALARRQVSAAVTSLRHSSTLRRANGRCSGCCTTRAVTVAA